jgi:hypothetical protein
MPRRYPETHYQAVVEVFEEAIEHRFPVNARGGLMPAIAVAETWGVPTSTAHRWLKEARRRGLLGRFGSYLPCNHRCPIHCHSE